MAACRVREIPRSIVFMEEWPEACHVREITARSFVRVHWPRDGPVHLVLIVSRACTRGAQFLAFKVLFILGVPVVLSTQFCLTTAFFLRYTCLRLRQVKQ